MESYRLQPPPSNPFGIISFREQCGEGAFLHSVPPNSLRYNLCADPYPLNLYGAIFYKDTVGRGVLVPSRPRNSFPYHRSETPPDHNFWQPAPGSSRSRVCRTHHLSRGSASDVLLESATRFAKLFPGYSSVVSEYVILRGRVRWVSSLVVGGSWVRASPFFVPTNN
jgi:hypothetical protein